MDFKRNMFMFRNLIMPCAPKSQGQNQTECVTVYLLWDPPMPGALELWVCSEILEKLSESDRGAFFQEGLLISPAGCIAASSKPSTPCLNLFCDFWNFLPWCRFPSINVYHCCSPMSSSRAASVMVASLYRTQRRVLWSFVLRFLCISIGASLPGSSAYGIL